MIEIVRAPAYLSVQDMGFIGAREIGLPRCGAMDRAALRLGNAQVGNDPGQPALEWALSGGSIRFGSAATIALTGARAWARVGDQMVDPSIAYNVAEGDTLEIERITSGRFLYLCISPAPDIRLSFGSCSTYLPASLGGFEGRRLRTGDRIPLRATQPAIQPCGQDEPAYDSTIIRVIHGPQSGVLGGKLLAHILGNLFTVSPASGRTGYRLDGPTAPVDGLGQIVSEPACEGSIQITNGGTPIVLMADGPTIGGYNKIAVVCEDDLPILAQKTPGEEVRFAIK